MGNQHPSPSVKIPLQLRDEIWPEFITSHDVLELGLCQAYRMENGLKAGNGEEWKTKWKTAPSLTRAKMAQKWPGNGENMGNCLKNTFPGHFWPFLGLSSSVAVFHFVFHSFPISGFQAVFHSVGLT